MRYSLLDLVQAVLSSIDGDEVNSINDTVESQQIVKIIKTAYDDILSRGDLKINKTLFTLTSSGDATKPVLMTKPNEITDIEYIKYNRVQDGMTDPAWAEIKFLPLESFVRMVQELMPSETNVDTFQHTTDEGFTLTFHYRNDVGPCYYTCIDDNTLIFDAYDSAVDSTLQSSKSLGFGTKTVIFQETDAFIPNLQPDQFSLLLNEAKSLAWIELKQSQHPKAESTARKNWAHLGRSRSHVPSGSFNHGGHPFDDLPNFGRK